ncbi:DUF2892 domain-containing protein [Clostridium ganghwense]|uniref:DUF2892 domain-containing protein n=1 Tax=Clostridium ganghwense TaxID=312089 RepID=A0ABT4CPE6_9CLOT|nr:DUF2892 domain-containing protein [Clostridium ganghwense]MCY6370922.1 DUF2892 domain-containing protein [Clostridium ganghwense]
MEIYFDEMNHKRRKHKRREIKKILPKSTERVQKHTSSKVNKQIYKDTLLSIGKHLDKSNEELSARIDELENEWDVDRVLETKASGLILTSLILGATVNKKWYVLSGMSAAFLLQHALQGWSPSLPMIRRMGFRTPAEIHEEMASLKYLRGDFNHLKRD